MVGGNRRTVLVRVEGWEPATEMTIDLRDAGDEVLFCIHGLGCCRESYADLWKIDSLDGYSVIVPDLVGFGESAVPDSFTCSMEEQAVVCGHLLDRWPDKRVHILGHSMGGAIGLLMADRLGDRLASFINIEGNLVPDDCAIASRKAIQFSAQAFIDSGFSLLRDLIGRLPHPGSQLWVNWSKKADPLSFHRSSASLVTWTDSGRLLEKFTSLSCPKIYLHGSDNAEMTLLDKLPGIPKVAIPRSGHFAMNDNPEEFYRQIEIFLKR